MTSEETVERGHAFAEETLGKTTIDSQDRAGFVVNALLIPYLLSAIRMYESGFASKEDIDQGMVKGCAHPMGPLQLADLIGLDTLLAVSRVALRGVPRPGLGRARAAEPDGRGGPARPQVRPRLLRLHVLVREALRVLDGAPMEVVVDVAAGHDEDGRRRARARASGTRRALLRQSPPRGCRLPRSLRPRARSRAPTPSSSACRRGCSSSTASGMATRTAMPSANVAERSQSTGCPASTLSAITGASLATTPTHADPRRGPRR